MFCFIICFSSYLRGQCPSGSVVVGSNVGINTLSQALFQGVLQLNAGGEVITNFCINGTFDADGVYNNCQIKVLDNSKLKLGLLNSNSGFVNCNITGSIASSEILVNGYFTGVEFVVTNISGFKKIEVVESVILNQSSNYTNIKTFYFGENSGCANWNSKFIASPITTGLNASIGDYGMCTYKTNCKDEESPSCIAISLQNGASFQSLGQLNSPTTFFETNDYAIKCENCSKIDINNVNIKSTNAGIDANNCYSYSKIKNSQIGLENDLENVYVGVLFEYSNKLEITNNKVFTNLFPFSLIDGTNVLIDNNPKLHSTLTRIGIYAGNNCILSNNREINSNITLDGTNLVVNDNIVEHHFYDRLITIDKCDEVFIHDNEFRSSNNAIYLGKASNISLNCNYIKTPKRGISFYNILTGTDFQGLVFKDNQIYADQYGMDLRNGIFPPQIDHGNDFYNYATYGFIASANLNTDDSYFRVRTEASENPPSSPPGVFQATGTSAYECSPMFNVNNDPNNCSGQHYNFNIKTIKSIYQKCYSSSLPISGSCHKELKRILKLIAKCPSVLNDPVVHNIFQILKVHDVAKLPNFNEVQDKLYFAPVAGPTQPSSFPQTPTEIQVFQNFVAQNAVNANLEWNNLSNAIAVEHANISAMSFTEQTVVKYQNALLWYLDSRKGLVPNASRKNEIIALANDCSEVDAPGGDIARLLCSIHKYQYESDPCVEIRTKTEDVANVSLYPNPASTYINIDGINVAIRESEIEIWSIFGQVQSTWRIDGSERVDISALNPGVYFISISGVDTPFKFIKL